MLNPARASSIDLLARPISGSPFLSMPPELKVFVKRIPRLLLAALAYTVLVCCHEAGHCFAAGACGFHPVSFRIGLGEPHLVIGRWQGTEIRLTPWLIGGSVQTRELLPPQNNPVGVAPGRTTREGRLKAILVALAGPLVSLGSFFVLSFVLLKARHIKAAPLCSLQLCRALSAEVLEALTALFLFRNMKTSKDFDYYQFLKVPWIASQNAGACTLVLISVTLSEAIFNLLPIPCLDGGKIAFDLYALAAGSQIEPLLETVIIVSSELVLFVVFFAACYRGFGWPVPKI